MIALTRSRQLILVSVLSVPVMIAMGAVGHLISLDASAPQRLVVPTLEEGRTEPTISIAPSLPTDSPDQTDRERQNVAMTQLQDGDWLMKQGNFKAAKQAYQALLNRSDLGQDSEVQNLASQRLEKLEKAIVAVNLQEKLKADARKKATLKPETKSAVKPPTKSVAKPVTLAAKPIEPLLVSAPDSMEVLPGELTPRNAAQPVSAIGLTGTRKVGENIRFERSSDLTTELEEPGFEREAAPVTPRLVPNFFAE